MSSVKSIITLCAVSVFSSIGLQAQQLFTTDVYVQSSLCVGLDCVVPESFGYATIKLKENNTQIKFEDSSTGTFPATDWTIGANETVNNGKNLFFIDDEVSRIVSIEAGAPSHAFYVNPVGNIGLKTNTPQMELHLNDSDSPTIRLEQNSGIGLPVQTYDILANQTHFAIRDVTGSNALPFVLKPGAPANSFFVAPTGQISLGANTQNGKLYINGSLVVNGNITALSDRRIKTGIADLEYGLDAILKLSSKQYAYIQESGYKLDLEAGLQFGLIAQEVESIIPEVVKNDFQVSDSEGQISFMKSVSYTELIPVLIRAIQEQQTLIRQKDAEISDIRSQLAALSQRIDQMEVR